MGITDTRNEQTGNAADRDDRRADDDISLTPNTFRQLNKMAFSARGQELREQHARPEQQRTRDKAERDQRMARMQAWDMQKVFIAGIEMTNAEAQDARRHILSRREEYLRRAINRGDIRADEGDALMRGIQRDMDLADKERLGTITDRERAERAEWRQSRLGAVGDGMIAHRVSEQRLEQSAAKAEARSYFPGAPCATEAFCAAAENVQPPEQPQRPAPPIAASLKQTGLDL